MTKVIVPVNGRKRFLAAAVFAVLIAILVCAASGIGQTPGTDQTAVLSHLNATITWYKNLSTKVSAGAEPSDAIYLNNAELLGAQIVRLAFQSARAQVELEAKSGASKNGTQAQPSTNAASPVQKYAQMEAEVTQRIADDESHLASLQKGAKGNRAQTASQVQSLQGKLDLDKATLDAVKQIKSFVENNGSEETGLKGSIDDLARSVPEIFGNSLSPGGNGTPSSNNKVTVPTTAAKTTPAANSGLLGRLIVLYDQMQNIRSIEQLIEESDDVRKIATDLRSHLRDQLNGTIQKEKELANQIGVTKDQYDALTQQFKNIAAALLPLSEELVVLDQSRSNLLQWRKAHTTESQTTLIAILSRVAIILISIGLIAGLAEIWRRLTFRYIHEPKRRRQFLLIRRFVMGFLIGLVVILGFASEFSSLATFAGFVTAGIAVGLQTILLSVAAYFFVIGRYGISVGDRISVAGVTGDVVDVGLVRFYLMEFAPAGADLFPTGRIVVFSNAVLFQATTPLFKQLPGTRYTWHEAVLPLASKADYRPAQKALEEAIGPVYKEYNLDNLWHRRTFDPIDIAVNPPAPEHRVQFSDSGPELVARYPVDLNRSTEIDDKITRALLDAIRKDDQLAASVTGAPRIRSAIKT
jgi:small-conductance mechanosensitive channel